MRMAPIFDEYNNLVAIDGIARDITQHVVTRERLRDLTTRLTQAHEDERLRIAHELHDHIGQALTVAKLRAKMIEGALGGDTARQKLGVLIDLLDEMLRDVRALSRELRPPLLEEMGWAPALELLCESFAERSGLSVGYQQAATIARLPHDSELAAYRVVQEALTNAARHAQAQHITVRTDMEDDQLAVSIADDGVGFDLDAATGEGAGLGLLGMQERVDTVGGTIHIDSTPGGGTRITAYLPREEGQHEDDYHSVGGGSSPGAGGAASAA
jgi:two-component system sensor histidine kinase NreB